MKNWIIAGICMLAIVVQAPAQFNWYFGNTHSHSDYSDGDLDNVCPAPNSATCCYAIGNTAQNFDFMGISDHNHNESTAMTPAKYLSGIAEANAYTAGNPGFVALYGMEWGTISTGGHVNVYGIDSLIGWNAGNYHLFCAKGDYATLNTLVNARPGAFTTLCHPNSGDYGGINTAYNAATDEAIVGICLRNGPYNSLNTSYGNPPASNSQAFYNTLLAKGYHLGPLCEQDNHNSATMGKSNESRTVVLAPALTKADIFEAYRAMRFYGSDDFNCRVTFTESSVNWMGSILTANHDPVLYVNANDLGGENASLIRILYGVPGSGSNPTVLTSIANNNTLNFTHAIAMGQSFYYYAEITQPDGDIIWTSPIWFTKDIPLPVAVLGRFEAHLNADCVRLDWDGLNIAAGDVFHVERAAADMEFSEIGTVNCRQPSVRKAFQLNDHPPYDGNWYYRIRYVGAMGESYSAQREVLAQQAINESVLQLWPNPSEGAIHLRFELRKPGNAYLKIIDMRGQAIWQEVLSNLEAGQHIHTLDRLQAPKGLYYLQLLTDDEGRRMQYLFERL